MTDFDKKYNVTVDGNGDYPVVARKKDWWDKEYSKLKYDVLLKYSGIPKEYHNLNFDDYIGEVSKKDVNFIHHLAIDCRNQNNEDMNLYLVGENSTQKTMIACAAGKEFMRQGLTVKFVLAGNLINHLLKLQGYNSDDESLRFIKELENAHLIIIDDCFDKNKSLAWKNESKHLITAEWDSFFREFLSNNYRFIITSNFKIGNISASYSTSLHELIDRNFISINCSDSVKEYRKKMLNNKKEKIGKS